MADLNKEERCLMSLQKWNDEWLQGEIATQRANLIQAIEGEGNYSQFVRKFLQSKGYHASYITKENVVQGILRHALLEIDIERSVVMIWHFQELRKCIEQLKNLRTEIRGFKDLLEERLCVYKTIQRGLHGVGMSPDNLQTLHDQSKNVEVIEKKCKSTVLECNKMYQKAQNDLGCWKESLVKLSKSVKDNIEVMKQNETNFTQGILSLFTNLFVRVTTYFLGREWELRWARARVQERHVDPQVDRHIQNYRQTLERGIQIMEQLSNIQ